MTKDFGDSSIRLSGASVRSHDGYGKAFGGRKCSFHVYGSGSDYSVLAVDDGSMARKGRESARSNEFN